MITVFKRTPWKKNPDWPDGFEPDGAARRVFVKVVDTEEEAIAICNKANSERPAHETKRGKSVNKGYYTTPIHEWTAE